MLSEKPQMYKLTGNVKIVKIQQNQPFGTASFARQQC
jgi:hypothetical protein